MFKHAWEWEVRGSTLEQIAERAKEHISSWDGKVIITISEPRTAETQTAENQVLMEEQAAPAEIARLYLAMSRHQ